MLHRRRLASSIVALAFVCLAAVPANADPVTDLPIAETLTFGQLSAPVDVIRDAKGIPHIYASNQNDAAFVLGNIHARERMFQMDVFRRIPSGTVSELLGFPTSRPVRTSCTPRIPVPGQHQQRHPGPLLPIARLSSGGDRLVQRALAGAAKRPAVVRRRRERVRQPRQHDRQPAPEYTNLHIASIAPWVPVDSVAFGKLQAFQLSFDFDDGPTNDLADITDGLGVPTGTTAYAQDLARVQPAENAFTIPDANNASIPLTSVTTTKATMLADAKDAPKASKAPATDAKGRRKLTKEQQKQLATARKQTIAKAREYIAKLMEQPVMREIRARGTVGSNQWAVDGSVTDTGNPIYANDPHLGLGSPSTFYELHVNTKDRGGNLNATGIGFAGAPGVVQGHNESIAWGSTTNPADVTDWYLEDMSTDGTGKLFSHYQGTRRRSWRRRSW